MSNKGGIADVLEKFGRYQYLQYFLVCLPAIFVTIIHINYVFVVGDANYRCKVPQCDTGPSFDQTPLWWPNTTIDRCSKPVLKNNVQTCDNNSFTGLTEECTEWIYERNDTVIAKLNLACQPWKISLVGTIHQTGTLVSMILSGIVCDRWGRKPALVICSVGGCIGHFKAFAYSYNIYVLIEFLESLLVGGSYTAAMIILLEISGTNQRLLSGVVFAYAIYFGEAFFALIAMYVHHWRYLLWIIYTPPLFFISYIYLVKESPRWQILNGKTEDAKNTIKLIGNMNKMDISEKVLDSLDAMQLKETFNMQMHVKKESYRNIFTSREILKRLFVGTICRFTASFVYYGLMFNSVWLPGNKYTNFMLQTLMSFPGELIALYLMSKIGRKWPLSIGYIISGALCLASAYTPTEHTWAMITLFLLGKMVIALCYTGVITYTMELFPTSARGILLGICAFASHFGAMLAPLTPLLMSVSTVLPSIFFGGSALISGLLLTWTPETKGLPLTDTVEQINIYARDIREEKDRRDRKANEDPE